jgi:hypothetical protein
MGVSPVHAGFCGVLNIYGYTFANNQLTALPGSPYPYGNCADMVVY